MACDCPARCCSLVDSATRGLRVPPAARQDHTDGIDLAVARHVLADHIDVVEASLPDREDGGIAYAARLEAAELRPLEGHRGVDRRGGDDLGQRHPEAQELR